MTVEPLLAASAASDASIEVLVDLVAVLGLCVLFGLVAQRLGQSVLVGYLLAGFVAGGPSSLGIVEDIESFSFMGEVGVALLLFTVGLDLPLEKVRRFSGTALVAGTAQVLLTALAAGGVAYAFGLSPATSFVVGFAVSLSSTAVVISVLADRSESDSVHGLVSTGVLVAQDVLVVLVLLLVPILPGATMSAGASGFGAEFAEALAKLAGLVALVLVVERLVLRRMFRGLGSARELLALASLTVSLGAIGLCWALELSPALGGFLAGIVMADATYAPQVRSEIAPIRMGLIAVFFAYVGMLADAQWMLQNLDVIGLVVLAILIGKAALAFVATTIARVPRAAAIMSSASLAQLGEFSFAVLTLGSTVGLVEPDTFRLLVSASLVTLLLTPAVIAAASRALHDHTLAAGHGLLPRHAHREHAISGHAIVVGVGPSGRAVTAALAESGVAVVVVELNVRAERGDDDLPIGTRVVFGDAGRPEILQRANVHEARILVVTIPDPIAIRTIIAQARNLAPRLPIVARGRYNRFVEEVRAAGADDVVDEESVTGRELAEVALQRLVAAGELERRRGERRRKDAAHDGGRSSEEPGAD